MTLILLKRMVVASLLTLAPRVLHWCCLASIAAPETAWQPVPKIRGQCTKVEGNEMFCPSNSHHLMNLYGFDMIHVIDVILKWFKMVQALQQKYRLVSSAVFSKALFWTSWQWYWPSPVHRWCRQPQHVQQLKLIIDKGDTPLCQTTWQWKIHVFNRKCTFWLGWFCIVMLVFGRGISCKVVAVERNSFCNPAEGAYETSGKYNLGAALFTYPSTKDLRGKQ